MDKVTVSSEQFRLEWGKTIDRVMSGQEVVIERYNRPSMVLVKYEDHEALRARLAELEKKQLAALLHAHAKEIEERNNANNGWMSHEELVKKLEQSHGPEFIAAIQEGLTTDVVAG